MRDNKRKQKGGLIVILAIAIPVLLGILGLVVDMGNAYTLKRDMQTGADAAAMSAMQEIRLNNANAYQTAALEDAARNGFDVTEDAQVVVNRPPQSGPRAGDSNFVEVIISKNNDRRFMRFFNNQPTTISARSVAGIQPSGGCVYALNPSVSNALRLTGTADADLGSCGVLVNSSNSSAAVTVGGAQLTAGIIGVVGDYSRSGFSPTPETGITAFTDPLADLQAPAVGSCQYNNKKIKKNETINPGVYCGGLTIQAGAKVTMNPGMYIMNGGGFQTNGGTITGDGVTVYLTGGTGKPYGPADFGGNTTVIISAPLDGPYKGVLFFQDRTISSTKPNRFRGTSSTDFKGVLYFPTTEVSYTGNASSSSRNTMIVADTVELKGTAQLASLGSDYSPRALSQARVVE